MNENLKIRKLGIKFDFKPNLLVHARMDSVATSALHAFPDWERQPLRLELWNKPARRKLSITFKGCYFESDVPDEIEKEIDIGLEIGEYALRKFEVTKLDRLGVGIVFALAEKGTPFDDLVVRLDRKFHVPFDKIEAFKECNLSDVAYTVDISDRGPPHLTRNVSIGPMTQAQFLQRHPLELRMFPIETQPLSAYREAIPEVFTYLSIDVAQADTTRQQAIKQASALGRDIQDMAESLAKYIQG